MSEITPVQKLKMNVRTARAFTLVEMLVVLLVITILIGIGLAVGTQVENSSEANLTKTELGNLQAALVWYEHKSGGKIPANMGQFLQGYQLDHAYPGPSGTFKQTPNILTALPANLVVTGTFNGPSTGGTGSGGTMTGVIAVLDAFGNPIQYVPPASAGTPTLYASPATPSSGNAAALTWLSSSTYYSQDEANLPSVVVNINTFQGGNWLPSSQSISEHAPYFFSFGPLMGAAQGNTTPNSTTFGPANYIYSYSQ